MAGNRIRTWHLMPTDRMGPPPGASPPMRMTASWSGSNDPTAYKSVTRRCAPMASSPRILRHRPPRSYAKARLAVHHRSACSGLKALRNTSHARRQAAKLCYRFGPLTPSARSANLIPGDGTKNGFPSSEQRTGKNQKRPLDRKSPIQVRIHFPPAGSLVRTCFLHRTDGARPRPLGHRVSGLPRSS